jgi:hypothetical protein
MTAPPPRATRTTAAPPAISAAFGPLLAPGSPVLMLYPLLLVPLSAFWATAGPFGTADTEPTLLLPGTPEF